MAALFISLSPSADRCASFVPAILLGNKFGPTGAESTARRRHEGRCQLGRTPAAGGAKRTSTNYPILRVQGPALKDAGIKLGN